MLLHFIPDTLFAKRAGNPKRRDFPSSKSSMVENRAGQSLP